MTNILIPTDFTAASLQLAVQATQALDAKNANIILFHAFEMPSSEFELLAPHRPKPYTGQFTDVFRQECKQLKDQYPKAIQKICFKWMEGSGAGLFRNFIDANEIDVIYCPDHYQYKPIHKLSVDPRPLFKKSGIRILREPGMQQKKATEAAEPMMVPAFATAG